jgi:hypothetical protein
MKKVQLFVAILIMGVLNVYSQPNYAGEWGGYITQKGGLAERYYFGLSLDVNGTSVSGHSEIRMWEDAEINGEMNLNGTFSGNSIELLETEINKQKIYTFAYWCLKLLKMEYSIRDGKEVLTGYWESSACTGPGEIYLERAPSA